MAFCLKKENWSSPSSKNLSVKGKIVKLMEENGGEYLCDLELEFLRLKKAQTIKGKNDEFASMLKTAE